MPKKSTQKYSIQASRQLATSATIQGQLTAWAHEGTQESVQHIQEFIKREPSSDLKGFAEVALQDGYHMYYDPTNEKEEEEFLLAKMITEYESALIDMHMCLETLKFRLKKLDIERRVHQKLVGTASRAQQEDWKYNFSEDFYVIQKNELVELQEDISYKTAWIVSARKLITTKKYQTIPRDFLMNVHLDDEGCGVEDDCGCASGCCDAEVDVDDIPF